MRILQVVQDLGSHSTGVGVTVKSFNQAFRDLGHSVKTLSFDRSDHPPETRPPGTVKVPVTKVPGLSRYLVSPSAAMGKFDQFVSDADVVFIHNLYGHHFTWAAQRAGDKKKACFVVPHGSATDFCLGRHSLAKKIWFESVRNFMEKHACLVFSAEYERRQALRYIRPARSAVLYWPAVPLPVTTNAPPETSSNWSTLLLIGRLHPMKRTLETIKSFRRVRSNPWRLCLAGMPSPQMSVNDIKKAAGDDWGKSIQYLGNLSREELGRWYGSSAALVLFSKGDNFSHVVAQGLLAGCPAYVSQDVGLGDFIQQHGCGRMFDIHSDADLDRSFREVLSDIENASISRSDYIKDLAVRELSFSAFLNKIRSLLTAA